MLSKPDGAALSVISLQSRHVERAPGRARAGRRVSETPPITQGKVLVRRTDLESSQIIPENGTEEAELWKGCRLQVAGFARRSWRGFERGSEGGLVLSKRNGAALWFKVQNSKFKVGDSVSRTGFVGYVCKPAAYAKLRQANNQ